MAELYLLMLKLIKGVVKMYRKVITASIVFALIAVVGVGVMGCGQVSNEIVKQKENPASPALKSITVFPSAAIVTTGDSLQFTAKVETAAGSLLSISPTWEVVGGVGIIDSSGLFKVASPGTGAVKAKHNGLIGEAIIIVTASQENSNIPSQESKKKENPVISRISVLPDKMTLIPNGAQHFQAVLYDSNNNVITDETAVLTWSVSGNVGTVIQSGIFTATTIGNGQVIAKVNNLEGIANVKVIDGNPPSDFNLIITTNEAMAPRRTYTINWTASGSEKNGLEKYQIWYRKTDWNPGFWLLKDDIDPSLTSTTVEFQYDGAFQIKVRAVDSQGLWRDSDGSSAAGATGDSLRILSLIIDTVPPGHGLSLTNIYNIDIPRWATYFDNPNDPIRWNSADDENLDHYEVVVCTNPNDIAGTSVYSNSFPANVTFCEVNLPTGFYYFYIVAYDKAGHYRTLKGKTDMPEYDKDFSFPFGLPMFGINGSALNFVTRWGSEGSGEAQFKGPNGIAVDKDNYVYVVDGGNNRIQKFDAHGNFVTSWGSFGTGSGQFSSSPMAIAVDGSSYKDVYVTDADGNVYIFHNNGSFVIKWPGAAPGESPGIFLAIAVDNDGNIYITDVVNHNVKKFSYGGTFLAKWGSEGIGEGQFNFPGGIAIHSNGNIYVADRGLDSIQKFNSSGSFVMKWGTTLPHEPYSSPLGMAIDNYGNLWVADMASHTIKKYDANGKFLLKWGHEGMDGPDDEMHFNVPANIVIDNNGNIYFTEFEKDRIWKFKE